MIPDEIAERFWTFVDKVEDGCWLWTRSFDQNGYGLIWDGTRVVRSHILAWRLSVGEVPEGRQLHHRCEIQACCNPAHLEPVTPHEHKQRHGQSGAAGENAARTHCKHGHPLSGANLKLHDGRRRCRACLNRRQREYMRRRREKIR